MVRLRRLHIDDGNDKAPFTMTFTDYYKELELERGASDDEVKKAFRRLARQYHPDANPSDPNAEDRFKKISEAYEVLSDPAKKAKYDQLSRQTSGFTGNGARTGAGGAGFSMDDVGDMFSGTSFGDMLSELFGQARPSQRRSSARQRSTAPHATPVYTVRLTLEEAFSGTSKRLTLGQTTADVAFRPGIASGQRLRIANVELEVNVQPHPLFRREGNDLHARQTVGLTTALLGGRVDLTTLAGTLAVTVPPGSRSEKRLRLKGQGMPVYGTGDERGDLYVTIEIDVPTTLTDEQRQLVERLRDSGL
jgi:curved DNA-binding protein